MNQRKSTHRVIQIPLAGSRVQGPLHLEGIDPNNSKVYIVRRVKGGEDIYFSLQF